MQKRYFILMLLCALISGTAVAALSQAKAHSDGTDNVYVYIDPVPIPGKTAGVLVTVYIDAPDAWTNTADGIVAYALSVRVDPTVLTVHPIGARKVPPTQASLTGPPPPYPGGFLEYFLAYYGYNYWDADFYMWVVDYPTDFYIGEKNTTSSTILDVGELIRGTLPGGVGAGGGPYKLVQFLFSDADGDATTSPSIIDLFGPPRPLEDPPLDVHAKYMTPDGVWHNAVTTDGAYIDHAPDKMYFDMPNTLGPPSNPGWDPVPIGSDWHELSPQLCNWWTLESHDDNEPESPGEPGVLDVSDQIDLVQIDGPEPGKVIWGHVDWINPQAEPGDGQADLIITVKPDVPEFPLGIGWIMTIALLIPVVYVWRRKRSK